MAPKIEWNQDSHLDPKVLRHIAKGTVTRESHPGLYRHLLEPCGICEEFLAKEGMKDTDDYDLHSKEVERILSEVLSSPEREEQTVFGCSSRASATPSKWRRSATPSKWRRWLWGWHAAWWMPLATAAFLLIVTWPQNTHHRAHTLTSRMQPRAATQQQPPPCRWDGMKGNKCAGGAFLELRVERPHATNETLPPERLDFVYGATYQVKDVLVLGFRIQESGFLYLLREDATGRLERLFPFSKRTHKYYERGADPIPLKHNGQRMAFELEPKHVGIQTFWLVHAQKPQTFPDHRSKLSPQQRRLFARADHLKFKVRLVSLPPK